MKILIKVKAGSKRDSVKKTGEGQYTVEVKAPPVEGKANKAVIELLSEYFDVPKSQVRIISGHKSKNKVVEIG